MAKIADLAQLNFNIILSNEADAEFEEMLHQQIREFNNVHSAHHRRARKGGVTPLNIVVRDADDQIVGGLAATTYWQWLDIDNFWLREDRRGVGIGREVLAMAEAEAIARGCVRVQLRTFDFQARDFYERQGYRVVGTLADYPPGGAMFWMRKEFDGSGSKSASAS